MMLLLLYGYFFLYIERPWEVWPRLAPFRIERIYMLFAMGVFALWRGKQIRWSAHATWVAVFLALHYLLAPFAFSTRAAIDQGFEYFKLSVSYFLILWTVRNVGDLKKLVGAYVAVMGLYVVHSFREYLAGRHWYRMGIARMVGVDQFANDPNAFAASIVMSLPFAWLIYRNADRRSIRWACAAYAALALYCVILTGSRSGFVTLALFILLLVGQARGRRIIPALMAVLIMVSMGWEVIPEEKRLRIESVWNPEVGPASARQSAEGRIEGLKAGLRIMSRRPLTGAGPGGENFMRYRVARDDGSATQAHNLLGEVLGEFGLPGGIAFFVQVASAWAMAGRTKRLLVPAPPASAAFLIGLASACRQALALLLFSGLFGHNLYRANWLWVGAWSFFSLHFASAGAACDRPRMQDERANEAASVTVPWRR